jgi:hypothetical protein
MSNHAELLGAHHPAGEGSERLGHAYVGASNARARHDCFWKTPFGAILNSGDLLKGPERAAAHDFRPEGLQRLHEVHSR